MDRLLRLLKLIERNFGLLLLMFAAAAFFFPEWFIWGVNRADFFIMLALFLGCLKIDFTELIHIRNNASRMLLFIGFNLVVFPTLFYLSSGSLTFDVRIGIFLVMAISGAVITPLLASFMNLKILWAVIYVVLTSLIVPFTLPVLVKLLFGIEMDIALLDMMLFLMKIVFIPVFSAIALRLFFKKQVINVTKYTGAVGTTSISMFLAMVITKNQSSLIEAMLKIETLWIIILLLVVYSVRFTIGWFVPASDIKERWTNTLLFGNVNNGLAIIIASQFFSPAVLLVALLSEIPYVLSQPIFQKVYFRHQSKNTVPQ